MGERTTDRLNLSNDRFADLVDELATSQAFEHRAAVLAEAARRLRGDSSRCNIRGCGEAALSSVLVDHPMREPFRVYLCGLHLTITSAVATITISPLAG